MSDPVALISSDLTELKIPPHLLEEDTEYYVRVKSKSSKFEEQRTSNVVKFRTGKLAPSFIQSLILDEEDGYYYLDITGSQFSVLNNHNDVHVHSKWSVYSESGFTDTFLRYHQPTININGRHTTPLLIASNPMVKEEVPYGAEYDTMAKPSMTRYTETNAPVFVSSVGSVTKRINDVENRNLNMVVKLTNWQSEIKRILRIPIVQKLPRRIRAHVSYRGKVFKPSIATQIERDFGYVNTPTLMVAYDSDEYEEYHLKITVSSYRVTLGDQPTVNRLNRMLGEQLEIRDGLLREYITFYDPEVPTIPGLDPIHEWYPTPCLGYCTFHDYELPSTVVNPTARVRHISNLLMDSNWSSVVPIEVYQTMKFDGRYPLTSDELNEDERYFSKVVWKPQYPYVTDQVIEAECIVTYTEEDEIILGDQDLSLIPVVGVHGNNTAPVLTSTDTSFSNIASVVDMFHMGDGRWGAYLNLHELNQGAEYFVKCRYKRTLTPNLSKQSFVRPVYTGHLLPSYVTTRRINGVYRLLGTETVKLANGYYDEARRIQFRIYEGDQEVQRTGWLEPNKTEYPVEITSRLPKTQTVSVWYECTAYKTQASDEVVLRYGTFAPPEIISGVVLIITYVIDGMGLTRPSITQHPLGPLDSNVSVFRTTTFNDGTHTPFTPITLGLLPDSPPSVLPILKGSEMGMSYDEAVLGVNFMLSPAELLDSDLPTEVTKVQIECIPNTGDPWTVEIDYLNRTPDLDTVTIQTELNVPDGLSVPYIRIRYGNDILEYGEWSELFELDLKSSVIRRPLFIISSNHNAPLLTTLDFVTGEEE